MKICILATGQSMSQGLADSLRAHHCIVINNVYELAPWASALCANDVRWWAFHTNAHAFSGRKFTSNKILGVERVESKHLHSQASSGVLGLEVARLDGERLGIYDIELHGFDNSGTHYFGKHPKPLNNATAHRFKIFEQQLAALGNEMKKSGFRIVNRTPNSALRCFEVN